jgi:hypothetical protein
MKCSPMPDRYVFADKAGNFDFSNGQGRVLIAPKIRSEFDVWSLGKTHYY